LTKILILTKTAIFDQNFDFDQNCDFWPKFWPKLRFLTNILILIKNFIVDQNFYFWPNFLFLTNIFIFDQNFYFWRTFLFSIKISIFDQHFYFWRTFLFSIKSFIFDQNFYLWPTFRPKRLIKFIQFRSPRFLLFYRMATKGYAGSTSDKLWGGYRWVSTHIFSWWSKLVALDAVFARRENFKIYQTSKTVQTDEKSKIARTLATQPRWKNGAIGFANVAGNCWQ